MLDITHTRFCDSSGIHTLLAVRRRAQADGGELLLVIPDPAAIRRANRYVNSSRRQLDGARLGIDSKHLSPSRKSLG